jgi:hypothetical protein
VTVRQKLTESETTLAFIVGGGMTLLIIGFLLAAAQAGDPSFDGSRLNILMIVGGFLMVAGTIGWFVITQPWNNFDDWSTPLYTGHDTHHGAHHDAPATHGQAIAEGAAHPDRLSAIDGITPKIEGVLNNIGIYTYAQLAARDADALKRVITDAGVRASGVAKWIEQAKQKGSAH